MNLYWLVKPGTEIPINFIYMLQQIKVNFNKFLSTNVNNKYF
jgi:hypothetical protein